MKPDHLTAIFEFITPEIAETLLAKSFPNRTVKDRLVRRLTGAILRDEWEVNGQTIKISNKGNLIDGQHRLHAILHAKRGAWMLVVRGLPETARIIESIDTGAARTYADVLTFSGVRSGSRVAAAVLLLFYWDTTGMPTRTSNSPPSFAQLDAHMEIYPDIVRIVQEARPLWKLFVGGSIWIAVYCKTALKDAQAADAFWGAVASGENLKSGDPALILRNRMLLAAARSRTGTVPMSVTDIAAVAIKAWNLYRSKKRKKVLVWRIDEGFPVIS